MVKVKTVKDVMVNPEWLLIDTKLYPYKIRCQIKDHILQDIKDQSLYGNFDLDLWKGYCYHISTHGYSLTSFFYDGERFFIATPVNFTLALTITRYPHGAS